MLSTACYHSPIGIVKITATDDHITAIQFLKKGEEGSDDPTDMPAVLQACLAQLDEYFLRKRRDFDLPLGPAGTAFQQQVWHELQRIPYGTTWSYQELAEQMGDTGRVRAVGNANSRNPIAIVVPCHRVIGSDGSLTGYAGGLYRKQYLLNLERGMRQASLF